MNDKYFQNIYDAKYYGSRVYHENGIPFTINRRDDGVYIVIADYPQQHKTFETLEQKKQRLRNERLNEILGE